MFLLGRIRNANEKDTITEEPISPEARLATVVRIDLQEAINNRPV